jgi:GT2 family glycosyltransferase
LSGGTVDRVERLRIAAIIPTNNRPDDLIKCLSAISSLSRKPDAVYLVENGSRCESLGVELPGIALKRIFLDENQGSAGGFRAGLERAYLDGFDWFWLLDDDCLPLEGSLEVLLRASLEFSDVMALVSVKRTEQGAIYYGEAVFDPNANEASCCDPRLYEENRVFDCDWAPNAGLLIAKEAVRRAGFPLSELFAFGEDTEYCWRMRRYGRIVVVPGSVVLHRIPGLPWPVPRALLWRSYYVGRNEVYLHMRGKVPPRRGVIEVLRTTVKSGGVILLRLDCKALRIRVLLAYVLDGLLGRMGRGPTWLCR